MSFERYPYCLIDAKPYAWTDAGVKLGVGTILDDGKTAYSAFWFLRSDIRIETRHKQASLYHITAAGLRKIQAKHDVRLKVASNGRRMGTDPVN